MQCSAVQCLTAVECDPETRPISHVLSLTPPQPFTMPLKTAADCKHKYKQTNTRTTHEHMYAEIQHTQLFLFGAFSLSLSFQHYSFALISPTHIHIQNQ